VRPNQFLIQATLGLCFLTSIASAEPADSDRDAARELMSEGRKLRSASDLQGALKSFSAANDLMHVPTTLFEVASTQAALGRLLEARDNLKRVAAFEEQKDEPEAFKKARQSARDLVVAVEQRIPTLQLSFAGDTSADPNVLIDGHPMPEGQDPAHLRLDPGKHTVTANNGVAKGEESVTLAEGETRLLTVVLNPSMPSNGVEPKTGVVTHYAVHSRPSPWAAYALGGVSALALGTGIAFGAEADHTKSSLEESCAPRCTNAQADRVHHWSTAANVSFGVGAAAMASAVILYFVETAEPADTRHTASNRLGLDVLPSTQGATLRAQGSF